MPATADGITYPDSTGGPEIWTDMGLLATTAQAAIKKFAKVFASGVNVITSGAGAGTIPPTPSVGGFLLIADSQVGAVNSASFIAFNFPTPFPNGLVSIIATPGDTVGGVTSYVPVASAYHKNNFTLQAFIGDIPAVSLAAVRVNYIAVGY